MNTTTSITSIPIGLITKKPRSFKPKPKAKTNQAGLFDDMPKAQLKKIPFDDNFTFEMLK